MVETKSPSMRWANTFPRDRCSWSATPDTQPPTTPNFCLSKRTVNVIFDTRPSQTNFYTTLLLSPIQL